MEVILIKDVDNLGAAHEVVKVRNGYARNFLIPQKYALEASPSNMKQLDEKRKQIKKNFFLKMKRLLLHYMYMEFTIFQTNRFIYSEVWKR